VTFVLADIEGSTRLVQAAGDRYGALISDVRRLIREAAAARDGYEVDSTGDESLTAFAHPQAGLGTAIAVQRALRDHPWPADLEVRMRVGVHTGTPTLTEDGYVGIDVIRAARIASCGHGRQIVLSASAAAFAGGFEVRDLGLHQLAGLPAAERIHQLLAPDLPRDFPPLRHTVSEIGGGRRVAVADDSVLLREGLVRLLDESGFEVVAQSGTAEELLRHVAMHRPDVAVVDVRMPPTHTDEGLRAAREIRERYADTGVLVLSQYVEAGYASELLAQAEGVGYLLKDRVSDLGQFAAAVRRVADGGSALDPMVVSELVGRGSFGPVGSLSPREREVMELMAEGRSNQAIAERMFVTRRAVEKHVTSIFEKLGLPAAADDHRRVLAVLAFLRM
jgi:DNA-binding NarL/FixJ family response regulator/class 3 adenylate cyclase